MVTININTTIDDLETVKRFLQDGLEEERKRIEYTLNMTVKTIKSFENKFGLSTNIFLEKFKNRDIEENDDTFEWWAESKLADELRKKLNEITSIEICQ